MLFGKKQVQKLQSDLERLSNNLERLENEWTKEKVDFSALYDKVYRIVKRLEMRERRANPEEEEATPVDSPCSDPISARVNARREARRHVLG